MKVILNEQDLIDAVCVFVADRYNEPIQELQGELHHEEGKGIFATANAREEQKTYQLSEQDIIDGAAIYMDSYHNFDRQTLLIELLFNEDQGISAVIDMEKGQAASPL